MTTIHRTILRRGTLLAALILLPLAVFAQDRPDRAERLQQAFDLTDAQVALVEDALGDEAERGDLWAVAVTLTPTLTDAQKEKLFDRPERPMRGARQGRKGLDERSGRSLRGERGQRGERRGGPDAEAHAERQQAQLDAMSDALDLTDAQVQQIEALHAERQARREAHRALNEEQRAQLRELRANRTAELEAILTPEQQEIARVHRALAARVMQRGMHRRGLRR